VKKSIGQTDNNVSKDLSAASFMKNALTRNVNEAWRKAKEEDPGLEFKKSFIEFKKDYLRKKNRKTQGGARK